MTGRSAPHPALAAGELLVQGRELPSAFRGMSRRCVRLASARRVPARGDAVVPRDNPARNGTSPPQTSPSRFCSAAAFTVHAVGAHGRRTDKVSRWLSTTARARSREESSTSSRQENVPRRASSSSARRSVQRAVPSNASSDEGHASQPTSGRTSTRRRRPEVLSPLDRTSAAIKNVYDFTPCLFRRVPYGAKSTSSVALTAKRGQCKRAVGLRHLRLRATRESSTSPSPCSRGGGGGGVGGGAGVGGGQQVGPP